MDIPKQSQICNGWIKFKDAPKDGSLVIFSYQDKGVEFSSVRYGVYEDDHTKEGWFNDDMDDEAWFGGSDPEWCFPIPKHPNEKE